MTLGSNPAGKSANRGAARRARQRIDAAFILDENHLHLRDHEAELEQLRATLQRRRIDLESIVQQAQSFSLAVPSWGFAQGGTRFGRFPARNEPRDLIDKIYDAAAVNDLTGLSPRLSIHIPWDQTADWSEARQLSRKLGLSFDAVNSNTFQDQPGQKYSYKYGSLSHTDEAVRREAIEHNLECIEAGQKLGSTALTVWLADGSSFPGQQHLRKAYERTARALAEIYRSLPERWRMLIEPKPFEPAFYATIIQDWGTALMLAQTLGPKAHCLVDLGHHLPNCNVELIVARLITAGRLGGFHFNDCKYADDDLSAGSIKPYQLFLIFNELVDAARDQRAGSELAPAYMIDQSHNLKDPIEDLIQSAVEIHRAFVKALLVNRPRLADFQEANDIVMAERELKKAFETDVSPILAEVRRRKGAALDPIHTFRKSNYRTPRAAGKKFPHR